MAIQGSDMATMMLDTPARTPWQRLRKLGILGMNERNASFVLPYNPRKNYPQVDDKRLTKSMAIQFGLPVPEQYAVIEIEHQLQTLEDDLAAYEDFVVKPSHGSGGGGILIVEGRSGGHYRLSNGRLIDSGELAFHISNILSGLFSLGGVPDAAVIEYRVCQDPVFEQVSYRGVPDIRVIVFRGVPVLAMVRLPTRISDGKANLHQGAIGVGIDLVTGMTRRGVWHETPVHAHPDTGGVLEGIMIPNWYDILLMSARCHDMVGLGYIGVDIVLDRALGPLMLEINARPGLNIQLAGHRGLVHGLNALRDLDNIPQKAEDRVALALEMYAGSRQA